MCQASDTAMQDRLSEDSGSHASIPSLTEWSSGDDEPNHPPNVDHSSDSESSSDSEHDSNSDSSSVTTLSPSVHYKRTDQ